MSEHPTRRRVLRAAAAATPLAVAGCSGPSDGDATDGETTAPGTTAGDRTTTAGASSYDLRAPPAFDAPDGTVDGVETFRGVPYADAPEEELRLDLHRPAGSGPHPLLVHVHGGGWAAGNRRWDAEGRRHARLGIAAATIDYRLSPVATYPAAVRDVVAAITWLRREAGAAAGVDPDQVVLIGESAGAHLAALVGSAPDLDSFRPPGVDPAADGVDGVVGISGIYHLAVEGTADEPLTNAFFGCTGDECPDLYREGSPATYVDAATPPTLLYHGTADGVVPYRASTMYRDDLRAAGVPVTLVTGEGGAHVTPYRDPWGERMRARQRSFLADRLELDLDGTD